MENTYEYIENCINYITPFVLENKFFFTSFLLFMTSYFLFNDNEIEKSDEEIENSDEELEEVQLRNIRNFIENKSQTDSKYKEIQSIILPKKGDYVEINYGRWEGYIGRITNVLSYDETLYNINVSIKDNNNYGNDIPPYLLKSKERSFFTILTDNEIYDYNLLDEDENIERYVATAY